MEPKVFGNITKNKYINNKKVVMKPWGKEIWLELNDKYCPKETIRDLSYCEKIYNRILKELTTRLNKFHNCAFSQKEWQIIFGNWLFQFICIVFRKYKSILVLINKNEFKNIYVNFSDQFTPSPDIFHLHSVTNQREWNERLTSKIIKFLANKKKINLINLNTKSKKKRNKLLVKRP